MARGQKNHRKKPKKQLTKHHRKPSSVGGTDESENISLVSRKKHDAWHLLFSNKNPEQIARIINRTWLPPDYRFIVQRVKRRGKRAEREEMEKGTKDE